MRILLIGAGEDEKLRAALRRGQVSFDGQAAGETLYLPENVYDVLVFFSAKPDAELFSTISQLRGENIDTPVLVLAEHATARSRIRLLDAGADNMLPYPCISGEILARRVPQMQREIITAGDLTLDRSSCVLRSRTGETLVSRKELQLVELFLHHPGQILPRETLHQKVWGADREAAYNNVEVYLTLVRRRLREIGSQAVIRAESGIGYYLQPA